MSVPRVNRSHICIDCLREIKMHETFFIINLYIPMLVFDNSIIFKENIPAVSDKIVWSTFVIWLLNFFFIPNLIKCKCFPCVFQDVFVVKYFGSVFSFFSLSFPSRPFNVFKNEHLPELYLSSLRPYYIVVLKSGGIW